MPLGNGRSFFIDKLDLFEVSNFKWIAHSGSNKKFYVKKSGSGGNYGTPLHRFLLNPEEGKVVDHINGSILNEDEVSEIKRLLRTGLSSSKIAQKYPVSSRLIRRIGQGKAWVHVS